MSSSARRDLAVLLVICALVFWWRLGRLGLIDPDEPFYALTAREMVAGGDWVVPLIFGQPQFEKPILFYWLAAASFAAFGQNEWAARVPAALFATLLVLLTWAFGVRMMGRRAGFLAALALATTVALAGTTRVMLTDVVFAFFVVAACFSFRLAADDPRTASRWVVLGWLASALAVLTKGPLGSLIPALALWPWGARAPHPRPGGRAAWARGLALYALVTVPWYAAMIARFGGDYIRAFFVHENLERLVRAEHPANNRLDYYPAVLLLGSIPWLPVMGVVLARARGAFAGGGLVRFLWTWILSSLAFFTLAQSKLPTYILFLFVPFALLMGSTLDALLRDGFAGGRERALALGLAILQAAGLLAVLALPEYRAAVPPAVAAAACLAVAAAALARGPSRAWVAASAAGTVALLVVATTFSAEGLEPLFSVRAAAEVVRAGAPARPVLSSAFLVRGVTWYTGRPPRVISNRPQPFFTPHPVPVVRGLAALDTFTRENGSTYCITRIKEWHDLERVTDVPPPGDRLVVGDKLVMRFPPEGALHPPRR
jgi:4-amino-4-deoxy-L-arabinose transferase-like glycosyltransferase